MLTLDEVYNAVAQAEAMQQRIAVAAIVTTSGSTPQRKGAKLLVSADGAMRGTVGGGCVEADVWAEAKQALRTGAARLCAFTLRDNPDVPPDEEGMVCGGEMEVLIEVWPPAAQAKHAAHGRLSAADIAAHLQRARAAGRSLAVVTLMAQGETALAQPLRLLVNEAGQCEAGALGDAMLEKYAAQTAERLLADERAEITVLTGREIGGAETAQVADAKTRAGDVRLLFELARPAWQLIICGGGHVGQAVAKFARLLAFEVTVIDDRAEFAARDKFPDEAVRLLTGDFVATLNALPVHQATHIVIVTRGHRHDQLCLEAVIARPARYLGMIGSRRRTTTIRERLRRAGVAAELLHKVHAPIGLDIGAQTPEEIALAILSEITLVRRGGTGAPKSLAGPMAVAR